MSPFPSSVDSEARAYRNASPGLRFFVTAVFCLALMFLDQRGTYLQEIRAYLGAALYPLQIAIDSPAAGARWVRENLALRERLIAENATLRRESLAASAQLQRLAALRAENARFRALLGSKARVPDRVFVGEILAVDMDPLRHRVILNKGSSDGAHEGQALLDADGVVGQITRDRQNSSEAILITDPDHAIPVEVVRNGLRTIAMGTGDLERLSLPFLTRNADIKAGDLLVASGLGGAFPAGYPVGSVTRVDGSSGDAFLEVAARPAASLDRLHEVLLVVSTRSTAANTKKPPAAAQPAPDATKPPSPAPPATTRTPAETAPAPAAAGERDAAPAAPAAASAPVATPAAIQDTAPAVAPPGEAPAGATPAATPEPAPEPATTAPEGRQG